MHLGVAKDAGTPVSHTASRHINASKQVPAIDFRRVFDDAMSFLNTEQSYSIDSFVAVFHGANALCNDVWLRKYILGILDFSAS